MYQPKTEPRQGVAGANQEKGLNGIDSVELAEQWGFWQGVTISDLTS